MLLTERGEEKAVIVSMGSSLCSRALFRLVLGVEGSRTLPPKDQSYGEKLSQGPEYWGKINILLPPPPQEQRWQLADGAWEDGKLLQIESLLSTEGLVLLQPLV